eukprot:CCRYP_007513-RB/>CCRYP_007513-RB protein AED:0.01 eAED:0.01 QI:528/1/1/1/1/1/3/448/742
MFLFVVHTQLCMCVSQTEFTSLLAYMTTKFQNLVSFAAINSNACFFETFASINCWRNIYERAASDYECRAVIHFFFPTLIAHSISIISLPLTLLAFDEKGSSIPSPMQQQSLTTDFELSQIVLVPTSDWDATSLGLGNRYDVYDGQQRLVTLNLLLAALRDSFQSEADSTVGGGKRAVALAATAKEISSMLKPTKVRKEDVLRITLRKRDNVLLEKILSPQNESTDEEKEEQAISMGTAGETPTAYLSKLTPKERNELLSPLSLANARIFENFLHISDRLSLLSTRERLRMLDYIVERVHFLVCIPETSRIARNIVMSQGRKGMDNEPIDDFKGLVCFRYTLEEKDMYQTFDRWDALAAEPTIGAIGETLQSSEQTTTPVGRDIISAACLLRSSAALRTKIRGGGADEVYEWERWLRHVLWLQNQRLAEEQETTDGGPIQASWQGKDFFSKEIEPSSLALYHFRTGNWDEFNFLAVKSKKADEQSRNIRVRVQLNFLRDMIASAGSAKEAEILALELLLRAQEHAAAGDDALLFRYLDEFLPLIERWSLWMALSRPSPMQRHARVFAILDAMEHNDSMGSVGHSSGYDDMETLKECMNNYKFGATASGKRLAVAILNRMNAYLMMKDGKEIPLDQESAVDAILPEKIPKGSDWDQNWTEEHHEEWIHCLGNLASISKTGARGGRRGGKKGVDSTSWEAKVNIYKKEAWPLTRELTDLDVWNVDAVIDRQKLLVSLLELIWKK